MQFVYSWGLCSKFRSCAILFFFSKCFSSNSQTGFYTVMEKKVSQCKLVEIEPVCHAHFANDQNLELGCPFNVILM